MKKQKSERKTYAKPRGEELDDRRSRDLVGLGLFLCFFRALENNSKEEMERIHKELDGVGLTIIKTEDGKYLLKEKEEKYGSLMTARIYTRGDTRECFICEDETMLPQMMRDFGTSVGRREGGKGIREKAEQDLPPPGVGCRKATGNRADLQKTDANGKMPKQGQRHAKNRVSDGFC